MLYTRKFVEYSSKLIREDVIAIMKWIESDQNEYLDDVVANFFYMRYGLIEDMYKVGLLRKCNNEQWKWVWDNIYELESWMIEYDEDYYDSMI